jgi:hypothetical protein
MKTLGLALVMTIVTTSTVMVIAAAEAKLGKGVALTKATPIEALTTRPKEFVGKTNSQRPKVQG